MRQCSLGVAMECKDRSETPPIEQWAMLQVYRGDQLKLAEAVLQLQRRVQVLEDHIRALTPKNGRNGKHNGKSNGR